ncbi:hypothetical protein OROMI_010044 [Orobanche minor]
MAAINSCRILRFDRSSCSMPSSRIKVKPPISFPSCPQFSAADFGPRLVICYRRNKALVQCFGVPRISCLLGDGCEGYKETEQSSFSKNYRQEAAIDLKLPRRSLLVTFTCDACGARSQRLINRVAYERGLVYVQMNLTEEMTQHRADWRGHILRAGPTVCSGCSQYHKLVDNLGLVVEYKLQEEIDLDASTDHA